MAQRRAPEAGIRRGIRDYLRMVGFAVWDLEQNRRTRQTAGFSDLVAVGHGRVIFIEVKTERGSQSPAQAVFEEEVNANGGTYLLWRSTEEAHHWYEELRAA